MERREYKQEFIDEFKKDYCKEGKFNLTSQIPHLAGLADHYLRQYHRTGDWTDCVKAHSLFNSISARDPANDSWRERAFKVQQEYWKDNSKMSYDRQLEITRRLKAKLGSVRQNCRESRLVCEEIVAKFEGTERIESSQENHFYECVKKVSLTCSEEMTKLAEQIMEESVGALHNESPCGFQAVAIGSLARGEATPYSDLEYLFLIEKFTPETVSYFERLAVTSYFLIGNLGETKLSYMAIEELQGWFDDRAQNGFKIDGLTLGAGNIPTGNGAIESRNHFIITPELLAEQYKVLLHNPDKDDALRGDLTAMMSYTTPLYANKQGEDLLKGFQQLIGAITPNKRRKEINMTMLKSDVKKFNFVPDSMLVGQKGLTVDVKKEIYRFPSIFLLDIKILLNSMAGTSWQALESLIRERKISKHLGEVLKFSLAAAVYIRLSAYLHHNSHDDRMSIAPSTSDVVSNHCGTRWYLPNGLFTLLSSRLIPVKEWMSERDFSLRDLRTFNLQVDEKWLKLTAQRYSGRFSQALITLQQICGSMIYQDPVSVAQRLAKSKGRHHTFNLIGEILHYSDKEHLARKIWHFMNSNGLGSHRTYELMAECLYHDRTFDEMIQFIESIPIKTPTLYMQLASAFRETREHKKAEQNLLLSLQLSYDMESPNIQKDYYGNTISRVRGSKQRVDLRDASDEQRLAMLSHANPSIFTSVTQLGGIYRRQKQFKKAKAYLLKAKELATSMWGDNSAIPDMLDIFNNLGHYYRDIEKFDKGIEYYNKVLPICKAIPNELTKQAPAEAYYNIGFCHDWNRENKEATRGYLRAAARYSKLSLKADLQDALLSIGQIYFIENQLYKAIEAIHAALDVCRGSRLEGEALSHLSLCYVNKEEMSKAQSIAQETFQKFQVFPNRVNLQNILKWQPGPFLYRKLHAPQQQQ